MFVWARVVCGPRYDQSPWLETSPVSGKINMQKIERDQDDSTCDKMKNFSIWRRFRDPKDLSGTHERALTRNELHTWLEELASESNTIQAQGILTRPGRLELQTL